MSTRVNRREASKHLGIKEPTLKKLEREGKGPPVIRIGRRRIYDTSDLDAYLAAHRHVAQEQLPAVSPTTETAEKLGAPLPASAQLRLPVGYGAPRGPPRKKLEQPRDDARKKTGAATGAKTRSGRKAVLNAIDRPT